MSEPRRLPGRFAWLLPLACLRPGQPFLGRDSLGVISEILVKRETIEKEEFEGLLAGATEEEVFGSAAPPAGPPIPGEPALVAALQRG